MIGIPNFLLFALLFFGLISIGLFIFHELHVSTQGTTATTASSSSGKKDLAALGIGGAPKSLRAPIKVSALQLQAAAAAAAGKNPSKNAAVKNEEIIEIAEAAFKGRDSEGKEFNDDAKDNSTDHHPVAEWHEEEKERRGELICNGTSIDSEVIYWRIVPGDDTYESPITPHHGVHHDRYLSFEYDNGGWNNVRMSLECLIVVAHATGRTLVIPPQQHLYLLGKTHQDPHDTKPHDEMGFEDFFDIDLLQSHSGFHSITMREFLTKEASVGGLNPHKMPLTNNDTDLWGAKLWYYLNHVADETPAWYGKFIAFPDRPGDFNLSQVHHPHVMKRLKAFANNREAVYYDERLQQAHHVHIRGDSHYRVLQHHYAFAFFADARMQSFYKRFIRDFMRYKDYIQCLGHDMIKIIRKDALEQNPTGNGEYYAMHIRRGDFQFKDVKISAADIVKNLNFTGKDGKQLIPPGSFVYISTDDPDGICKDCYVQRKPCTEYQSPKPEGCPEDTSWNAFMQAGWKIRFLRDYMNQGYLKGINGNLHGMIEVLICSRAKVFVGTYFSTFTGYIHRIRGFHGLGEDTYYHHQRHVHDLQKEKSIGNGFSREWRYGWTDDGGELI